MQSSVVGDTRLANDDGGHLIDQRFMSDQGTKNLFPQNSNLNRSAYKTMENEWADWADQGFEVRLKVKLNPLGAERPYNIISSYEIYNSATSEQVVKRKYNFSNQPDETFNRVSKSDMNLYR